MEVSPCESCPALQERDDGLKTVISKRARGSVGNGRICSQCRSERDAEKVEFGFSDDVRLSSLKLERRALHLADDPQQLPSASSPGESLRPPPSRADQRT